MDVAWPGGDLALVYVALALLLVSQVQVRRVSTA
jgi:hypothetical protein